MSRDTGGVTPVRMAFTFNGGVKNEKFSKGTKKIPQTHEIIEAFAFRPFSELTNLDYNFCLQNTEEQQTVYLVYSLKLNCKLRYIVHMRRKNCDEMSQ